MGLGDEVTVFCLLGFFGVVPPAWWVPDGVGLGVALVAGFAAGLAVGLPDGLGVALPDIRLAVVLPKRGALPVCLPGDLCLFVLLLFVLFDLAVVRARSANHLRISASATAHL